MGIFNLFGGGKNGKSKAAPSVAGDIFRYTHTLQIWPRIRAIGAKLGHFAYMLAMVFRSTRLLPANHPMLNPVNIGRYGITDVIATAANGLVLKRENLDQILVFGAVVLGMLMIVVQTVVIALYAFLGNAHAADGSMFQTPHPENDLITIFLSQVFGFSNIFASGKAVAQPGLYALLSFYSTAMMIFAVLIVVYYVITVVGESAQTGQPFGKRFNGLWAPIRLVLALGLLVPLGGGINAAQYLTLYVAKFGSGLATQGWIKFSENYAKPEAIISSLAAPSARPLAGQIFAAEVCRGAYNQAHSGTDYPVRILVNAGNKSRVPDFGTSDISFAKEQKARTLQYVWTTQGTDDDSAAQSSCGAIEMPVSISDDAADATPDQRLTNQIVSGVQTTYIQGIGTMIRDLSGATDSIAENTPIANFVGLSMTIAETGDWKTKSSGAARKGVVTSITQAIDHLQDSMNKAVQQANDRIKGDNSQGNTVKQQMQTDAAQRGWGTAGVYYLEIAKFTQMVMDAIGSAEPKQIQSPSGAGGGSFWDWVTGKDSDKDISLAIERAADMFATAAGQTSTPINSGAATSNLQQLGTGVSGFFSDPILWVARTLFGDSFIMMFDQPTLNPMGALIASGKSVLDHVKWLLGMYALTQVGTVAATLGGMAAGTAITAATGPGAVAGAAFGAFAGAGASIVFGAIFKALGALIWALILVSLAIGVILFYMLPLLPFMYFFFSVVNWVIEVAEAFISMPLFALSHLRIDGEGLLPSRAFENWLILFGILLRPLMIVTGMIIGSLVFNAGVYYLGSVYKYAIFSYNNSPGAGVTITNQVLDFSHISGFGMITYMILYVYLVYMLAASSFKLIDQIPDKMLRWIGGPTPFTGDRPVSLEGMQGAALLGYGMVKSASGVAHEFSGNIEKGIGNMADARAKGKGGGKGAGVSGGGTP